MNFLLNPVVICQFSTNVTIRSVCHSWSFLPSLKHFLHLASRKPHCLFWVTFFSYLLGLSFSFFFAPPHLPDFLTWECPGILVELLVSVYTYDLGDVIQAQSFKYYPHANDSKITAVAQDSTIKSQILICISYLNSLWISNQHITLKFKTKLLLFSLTPPLDVLPTSVNSSRGIGQKSGSHPWFIFFSHNTYPNHHQNLLSVAL